jgi:hypothetical protein
MSLVKSFGYHRGLYWQNMLAHSDLLTQQLKICSQCKVLLSFSAFGKDSKASDGLKSACKACRRQAALNYSRPSRSGNTVSQDKGRQRNQKYTRNIHDVIGRHIIYYIANPVDPSLIKIGYSASLYYRFETFLTAIPKLFLLALSHVDSPKQEVYLHRQFAELRSEGEWFLAKTPLLQHLDSLDQSLAHQCIPLLTPSHQKRVVVPDKHQFIDSLPFLGK